MTSLPLSDGYKARELIAEYRAVGVDRLVCAMRYRTLTEYQANLKSLVKLL